MLGYVYEPAEVKFCLIAKDILLACLKELLIT